MKGQMHGRCLLAVGIFFTCACSAPASTESSGQAVPALFATDADREALMSARSLKCTFPLYSSTEWQRDRPTVKTDDQDFGFQIDGIDYSQRTARMIGNAGADDLEVAPGTDTVSFVERVPAGAVNLTTVYAWRDSQGGFKAVHSRHTAIGGPTPSQQYGRCELW